MDGRKKRAFGYQFSLRGILYRFQKGDTAVDIVEECVLSTDEPGANSDID